MENNTTIPLLCHQIDHFKQVLINELLGFWSVHELKGTLQSLNAGGPLH